MVAPKNGCERETADEGPSAAFSGCLSDIVDNFVSADDGFGLIRKRALRPFFEAPFVLKQTCPTRSARTS